MEFVSLKASLCCGFASLLFALPVAAKPKPSAPTDRDYRSALATANRFLHAWQAQDQETGLLMLTDAAKRGTSMDRLQSFFSPGPQAAFEISRGRKLKTGRYAFPITLFATVPGKGPLPPRLSQLIVTRTSKDDWAVDKLP